MKRLALLGWFILALACHKNAGADQPSVPPGTDVVAMIILITDAHTGAITWVDARPYQTLAECEADKAELEDQEMTLSQLFVYCLAPTAQKI